MRNLDYIFGQWDIVNPCLCPFMTGSDSAVIEVLFIIVSILCGFQLNLRFSLALT